MGVVTRGKKRRLQEEELVDRISLLPDDVLRDIVSLLPTKDGARTQLLSSRWRPIWRSAPLNFELRGEPWRRTCLPTKDGDRTQLHSSQWRHIWRAAPLNDDYATTPLNVGICTSPLSHILSSHPGPGHRFSFHSNTRVDKAQLDIWLRSPSLNNLEELEIHYDRDRRRRWGSPPQPLPASVLRRFSSTLAVASFKACVFPDCSKLHWPVLKKLTLRKVTVSESSLHALLIGCSALESLLLQGSHGFSRVEIVSPSLRSIGVSSGTSSWRKGDIIRFQQLVIEDAPCLERLLFVETFDPIIHISIVSAPRLSVLGELIGNRHIIRFGTAALQGSTVDSLTVVVPSMRVLALSYVKLDAVINLMRCFPHLEKLYIKRIPLGEKNESHDKYLELAGTLDIRLKKVVLPYHEDCKIYINFAKLFVRSARRLESMTLQIQLGNVGNNAWIIRQRKLLEIEKRASRRTRFYFVSTVGSFSPPCEEQVHDLSILDPFLKGQISRSV